MIRTSRTVQFLTSPPRMIPLWSTSFLINQVQRHPVIPLLMATALLAGFGWILFTQFAWTYSAILIPTESLLILLAWRFPRWVLSLLLAAFVLSPRLTPHTGDFPLRADDLIVAAVVIAFLLKQARSPEHFLSTPMDPYLVLFFSSLVMAASLAIISRTLASPLPALYTLGKLFGYIVAFYLAYASIQRREDVTRLLHGLLLCGLILSLFGLAEFLVYHLTPHAKSMFPHRIFNTFPFQGESNHMAGFLLITGGIATAMGLKATAPWGGRLRWLGCSVIFLAVLFLISSRSALALALLMTLFLCAVTRSKIGIGVLISILILGLAIGGAALERFSWISEEWQAYQRTEARVEVGLAPEFSYTRNRFEVWSLLRQDIQAFPWLGTGPGSRHRVLYENQYLMTLAETGVIGLGCFLLLLMAVLRGVISSRQSLSPWPGLTLGVTTAFVGICLLGLVSVSFTISRIAGPMWMLIGMALKAKYARSSSA